MSLNLLSLVLQLLILDFCLESIDKTKGIGVKYFIKSLFVDNEDVYKGPPFPR